MGQPDQVLRPGRSPSGLQLPRLRPGEKEVVVAPSPSTAAPRGVSGRRDLGVGLWAGAVALAVYLLTLAPTLTFRHSGTDGGDLIAAARTLGVPHPPGYPTYTLLAALATHLPVGSIAYRVNLLSALSAACGVCFHCFAMLTLLPRRPERRLLAFSASLALAFAPLTWSQAIISEVYATALLFASLSLFLAVRWRDGGPDTLLWLAALVFGLSLGIHVTLAFAALPAVILLWPQRSRWKTRHALLPAAAALLAGLAVFAYLPLAAQHRPPVNWGHPDRWDRFLWVVTAKLYQPMALGLPASKIAPRLAEWARLAYSQFGWIGSALMLVGLPHLWQRDRALALSSVVWLGTLVPFAFFYSAEDSHVLLLPALSLPALWLCEGAASLAEAVRRSRRRALPAAAALLLLLPTASLARNWNAVELRNDRSAAVYVDQVLAALDPNAIALTQGGPATFSLWYALYAEGRRQDVAAVNASLLGYDWYRDLLRETYPVLDVPEPIEESESIHELARELVHRNCAHHPVYALDLGSEWEIWFDTTPVGDAPAYRVQLKHQPEQAP